MQKLALAAFFAILLAATTPVYADDDEGSGPVPEEALLKDYQNCMGKDTPESNPDHAKFCECAYQKMHKWNLDTYGAAATDQAKHPTDVTKINDQVGEVVKACLAEVFQ